MPSAPDWLALFAKAAIPGRVKTRLTSRYTPQQAAAIHAACVQDSWGRLAARYPGQVWLFCDQEWPDWLSLAGPERFRLQRGDDLGERMRCCFEDMQAEGAGRMAILGSDSPTLPLELVDQALDALADEADASLIPTEDGGYCLIGCRSPQPGMFDGVSWSTASTLDETEQSLDRSGYRVRRVGLWRDVDEPKDVDRLGEEGDLGKNLRRLLQSGAREAL